MVYLSDKGSGSVDMKMRRCTSESESQLKKTCVDCGTSKSPLWRSGPAGPKSLCNACGIKSRKKRRPTASISKENKKSKNETTTVSSRSNENDECKSSDKEECKSSDKEETRKNDMENMVKRIKMVLNGETPSGTSNNEADSSGCNFGEEERAAILLMALSYDELKLK